VEVSINPKISPPAKQKTHDISITKTKQVRAVKETALFLFCVNATSIYKQMLLWERGSLMARHGHRPTSLSPLNFLYIHSNMYSIFRPLASCNMPYGQNRTTGKENYIIGKILLGN
jgi:hypothetical protein